jgi:hypothetical protein
MGIALQYFALAEMYSHLENLWKKYHFNFLALSLCFILQPIETLISHNVRVICILVLLYIEFHNTVTRSIFTT